MANITELGGFAGNERAIDGDEQDLNAFNFCLAEDYLYAMRMEDWHSIGEIDLSLLDNVVRWLNYDGEIGKGKEEEISNIPKGLIITNKNRTFADAVIDCHKGDLADILISNHNHDIRLYLTAILYGDGISIYLLDFVQHDPNRQTQESFVQFFHDIFEGIAEHYDSIPDSRAKLQFLKRIRPYLLAIHVPRRYEVAMIEEKKKVAEHSWYKQMRCISSEE